VEAVINGHPHVRMSRVRTRKSPITGALVIADVVLHDATPVASTAELEQDIAARCRAVLARHKVPAAINVVPALPVTAGGKLVRHGA
jgi:acyl-coenzyme A synthetase/AMP-(fatty) acid ligase